MQLFFDSGATKCDCILLDDNGLYINHYTDKGINASYSDDNTIQEILHRFREQITEPINSIQFSGAGCGNSENQRRMHTLLASTFPGTAIEVVSDLVGACLVMSRNQKSMVAILGTGASACLFDGEKIVQQAPSLGYLLGDEGSGTYLGKLLIQRYLRNELDTEIKTELEKRYNLTPAEAIRRMYRESAPNLFFSNFAHFLSEKKNNPFTHQLLLQAFTDFFKMQICYLSDYQQYPLNILGSIAFHFEDVLKEAAIPFHVKIDKVAASPLERVKVGK